MDRCQAKGQRNFAKSVGGCSFLQTLHIFLGVFQIFLAVFEHLTKNMCTSCSVQSGGQKETPLSLSYSLFLRMLTLWRPLPYPMAKFLSVLDPQNQSQISLRIRPTAPATAKVQTSKSSSFSIFQFLSAQQAILSAIEAVQSAILPLKFQGQQKIHSDNLRVTSGSFSFSSPQLNVREVQVEVGENFWRETLMFLRIYALTGFDNAAWSQTQSIALRHKQAEATAY